MSHRTLMRSLIVCAVISATAVAQAQTRIKAGFNLFSAQDDVEIGQQSSVQAEQQLPMLNDPQVNAYVSRIGQRLAANAGGPQFHYEFHVVNQSDINAFALPGGWVYVNRGVLDQARNEGEVAGVLAHEIAHVALRHGTHQASKAYLAQAGISILGGILGGRISQGTAQILNAVGGIGLNALFLKYSRDLETQADIRGAQILAASGYSPVDMVNFFRTLERVDTSRKTNWLSDHPAPPDRIARIEREEQLLHVSGSPTENVAELHQVQSRLRGYAARPGEAIARSAAPSGSRSRPSSSSPAQSISVPAPSTAYATYTNRSGVYRIAYPSNWKVYESGSTGVTIAPPGGAGDVNGTPDIVYGAVVNHYDPFGNVPAGEITLQEATRDLVSAIQQSSPYLRLAGSRARVLRLAGGTALAATLRGTDPVTGINERVTVVTRQLSDEHLLYLLFITPERDASSYGRVLNAMISSLQVNTARAH